MGIFFNRSKRSSGPMVYGEGLGYYVRTLVLFSVIVACIVGFWYNFEHRFEQIEAKTAFGDATDLISATQKTELLDLTRRFENDWGIDILIRVRPDVVYAPIKQKNMLFIGFVPKRGQTLLLLPPLLKKVIPDEALRFVTTELDSCVRQKMPSDCIKQTIATLDTLLRN